jgi:peroxiredoxin
MLLTGHGPVVRAQPAVPATPVVVTSGASDVSPAPSALGRPPSFDLNVPAFSDGDVTQLTASLGSLLTGRPADAGTTDDAAIWEVARGFQTGRLSSTQRASIRTALADAAHRNSTSATLATRIQHMVDTLTIGRMAPDITGRDLAGTEFKLSDYRGKVVALIFSGEWCGICRTQYPYERLLLELYKNWPFALVGVDSDVDRDGARKAMTDRGLTYRAWWDGFVPDHNTDGPIATSWDVAGWPTVYLIDSKGVIRFVDLRQEDLLKGVRELLSEQPTATPTTKVTKTTN